MHLKHLFSISILLLPQVIAQEGICWGVNGKQWTSNKRCPGSSACCGKDAKCMPNRLCQNKGQAKNKFVRGPCAVAPYDKKKCAAICIKEEKSDRFPRVEQCDDGSYCCVDDDPSCCAGNRGVFLDSDGSLDLENSTTTSSGISSTFSTGYSATSAQPSATSTDGSDMETSDNSQGVKIGLGVGIPIAAIIAALSIWLLLRRRSKKQSPPASHPVTAEMYEQPSNKTPSTPQELEGHAAIAGADHQRSARIPSTPQELEG